MSGEIYSIASLGLSFAQKAMAVTSRNISNSSVDGYSRQRFDSGGVSVAMPDRHLFGQGGINGVVTRSFDSFVASEVRMEDSAMNAADMYQQLASDVDNLVADTDTNLS